MITKLVSDLNHYVILHLMIWKNHAYNIGRINIIISTGQIQKFRQEAFKCSAQVQLDRSRANPGTQNGKPVLLITIQNFFSLYHIVKASPLMVIIPGKYVCSILSPRYNLSTLNFSILMNFYENTGYKIKSLNCYINDMSSMHKETSLKHSISDQQFLPFQFNKCLLSA